MATATYPYDHSGEASTNMISNELHNVQPPADVTDASFIIPRAAPFFINGLKVKKGNTANAEVLLEGIHYITTHHFVSMSAVLGTPIYSSITFLDRNYSGTLYLDYQTLGGQFVLDSYTGVEELTRNVYSIYSVTWEQVSGLIQGLPPQDHNMPGADTTSYGDMVDAIKLLAASIRSKEGGSGDTGVGSRLDAHLDATTSHTKNQVGLGRVENFGIATNTEAKAASVNTKYMTPLLVLVTLKYYLEQAGIATTPQQLETLLINYNLIASRITGVNDNLNTVSNNLTNLASQVDGLVITLGDTRSEFINNINSANQSIDSLARELLDVKAGSEDLSQDIFFNANEIEETNRKLTELEKTLVATNLTVSGFANNITNIINGLDKIDPIKNPDKFQIYLTGFHKFSVPPGWRAKVTLIGAVTTGNTDPDTKLYEGTKYDSSNNSYYAVVPNINSPVATAPGGVAGTLVGRTPSHSLPNAVVRTGNPAVLQSSTSEGISYTGGDGQVINSVTYGLGITGSPAAASAGASMLETTFNNTATTALTYHVYVGEGKAVTTLSNLVKTTSGICVVELTKNP